MAFALLSNVGEQVNSFLRSPSFSSSSAPSPSESSLSLQVQDDLEALQRTVRRIQAVLQDAENRELRDESVKLWLRELRGLAYDADDVLDWYDYQVLRSEVEPPPQHILDEYHHQLLRSGVEAEFTLPPGWQQKQHQEIYGTLSAVTSPSLDDSSWMKLGDRIGEIRHRFEEISRQREALHLSEEADIERQFEKVAIRPPSTHFPDAPSIYGRSRDVERVIDMLLQSDGCTRDRLSILPIVGMGGVGKTTLVQHVYNDQRVCKHFNLRGWVCVSDDFAVVPMTRRIIQSLGEEACGLNEFDVLQNKLRRVLDGSRFLIVLDDVWTEKPTLWDSFLKPFRLAGVEGSAVITTTRIESVARIVQTMPFYRLGCLADDDCWLIFEENAFCGRDTNDHRDLVQIGRKIAKKCKGLPLAIKVLASLLCNEFDRHRWEDVLQSDLWDVQDQRDEIIPALKLSYLHMPSYLKPCFLYASMFPKDFKFSKQQLVQLWMAQGFLECRGRKQPPEDIGNKYFDDLRQRSLFQYQDSDAKDQHFTMHDLIHDLAQYISGGEFFSIGKAGEEAEDDGGGGGGDDEAECVCPKEVRHLSIYNGRIDTVSYCAPGAIHTILVLRGSLPFKASLKLKVLSGMMLNLESLRALDLGNLKISELPRSIDSLKHLRYLNLQGNPIGRLPTSICKLYHLQTLNLNRCDSLKWLPEDIKLLCNLRRLEIKLGNRCTYPRGMSGLTNLRSLIGFTVLGQGHRIGLLKDMLHLKGRLKISGLEYVTNPEDARMGDLRSKGHIRDLILHWSTNATGPASPEVQTEVLESLQPPNSLEVLEIRDYGGLRFPSWMGEGASSFCRLTRVSITGVAHCTSLPPLGQIPYLNHLSIGQMDTVESVGPEFQGALGFPSLDNLCFSFMHGWVRWVAVERGDFCCLRRLMISDCSELESMVPVYILPSLQELVIRDCRALTSIQLKRSSASSSSSSSSSSSMGPPPLKEMAISGCPRARFSPEDEQLLLPPTLCNLTIDWDCPLLVEWCEGRRGRRLAHIPRAKIWTIIWSYYCRIPLSAKGKKLVTTNSATKTNTGDLVVHNHYGSFSTLPVCQSDDQD